MTQLLSTLRQRELLQPDSQHMLERVQEAPQRARLHWQRGLAQAFVSQRGIHQILVCGMGGSGSTGDLLQALAQQSQVPIWVHKSAHLPTWVGPQTLVVGVSYSGNTQETLASLSAAQVQGAQMLLLSSGGKVQALAEEHGLFWLPIDGGLPPRAALFDMLFALLGTLAKLPELQLSATEIERSLAFLGRWAQDWSLKADLPLPLPFAWAEAVQKRELLFWGSDAATATVAQRWKNQCAENAKTRAFWSVLPELNHNEMVAICAAHHSQIALFYLTLEEEIQVLDRVTLEMVQPQVAHVFKVQAQGNSQPERILYLTYLGDFLSVYLALLKGVNPTPIQAIETFKQRIAAERL